MKNKLLNSFGPFKRSAIYDHSWQVQIEKSTYIFTQKIFISEKKSCRSKRVSLINKRIFSPTDSDQFEQQLVQPSDHL